MSQPLKLAENFIHLGLGATCVPQPEFDGMAFYQGYGERHGGDGAEGRLVSMYTFTEPWDSWEVHPNGEEVVLVTAGEMSLIQEIDGKNITTVIQAGHYGVNPKGVWHTADVATETTCVFITAGENTQHRPR